MSCVLPMRSRAPQTGAAAVEFAFVLPVLILVLFGLATFGNIFYTQMTLTRAAADGARAVSVVSTATSYESVPEAAKTLIKLEVINSLALSIITPLGLNDYSSRQTWLQENVLPQVTVDNGACGSGATVAGTLRVRVAFPYRNVSILPPIRLPFVGSMDGWMPQTLTGCAIALL